MTLYLTCVVCGILVDDTCLPCGHSIHLSCAQLWTGKANNICVKCNQVVYNPPVILPEVYISEDDYVSSLTEFRLTNEPLTLSFAKQQRMLCSLLQGTVCYFTQPVMKGQLIDLWSDIPYDCATDIYVTDESTNTVLDKYPSWMKCIYTSNEIYVTHIKSTGLLHCSIVFFHHDVCFHLRLLRIKNMAKKLNNAAEYLRSPADIYPIY